MSQALADLPESAEGVDQAMRAALEAADPDVVDPLLAEAEAASERSALYGKRAERATFSLALVAFAAALLGLAG